MDEKVFDVEMIYIQSPAPGSYTLEFIGRRQNAVKLNFRDAEGVEFNTHAPVEMKSFFLQMSDPQPRVWNMRFGFPVNLKIRFSGRVVVESM